MDCNVTTSDVNQGSQTTSLPSPCAEICWKDSSIGLEGSPKGLLTSMRRWSLGDCLWFPLANGDGRTCWMRSASPGVTMSLHRCRIRSAKCRSSWALICISRGCWCPRPPCGSNQVLQSTVRKPCLLRYTASLSEANLNSGCSFQLGGGMMRPPSGNGMKSSKSNVMSALGRQVKGWGFDTSTGFPTWPNENFIISWVIK